MKRIQILAKSSCEDTTLPEALLDLACWSILLTGIALLCVAGCRLSPEPYWLAFGLVTGRMWYQSPILRHSYNFNQLATPTIVMLCLIIPQTQFSLLLYLASIFIGNRLSAKYYSPLIL